MRSRYAAYATGNVDYILITTHADSPHRKENGAHWRADLTRFVEQTTFDGLTVRATTTDSERGTVTFEARLRQGGRDATMVEESQFFRVDGRWLYHSETRPPRGEPALSPLPHAGRRTTDDPDPHDPIE